MPLFDYDCRSCGTTFEALVRASAADPVACPDCASRETARSPLARFAVGAGGSPRSDRASFDAPAAAPGGCGRCGDPRGPGACALD